MFDMISKKMWSIKYQGDQNLAVMEVNRLRHFSCAVRLGPQDQTARDSGWQEGTFLSFDTVFCSLSPASCHSFRF